MRTVLVTGASTGIGRATALRLALAGWSVLAGVREPAAGEQVAAAAQAAGSRGTVIPVMLDVTDSAQIAQAAALVRERVGASRDGRAGGLDGLVNNAGVGAAGPLELISLDQLRAHFEVNVFGQVAVTQALLPALRAAHGRIVLVSSIGGLVTIPFSAPYGASKHALEAIGDALRGELHGSGIQVSLIEPGSVKTSIWGKSRADAQWLKIPPELESAYGHIPSAVARVASDTERRGIPPERVAGAIERALSAPRMRARYLVGGDARAMLLTKRLLPDLVFDRVVRRALRV